MRLGVLLVGFFTACAPPGEYAPFKMSLLHGLSSIDVTLTNPRPDAECLSLDADQNITWNGMPLAPSQQAWVCTASRELAVRTVYFLTLPNAHERADEDVIELKGLFKARFPSPVGQTNWITPADGVAHAGDVLAFELRTTIGTPRMMNGFLRSPTDDSLGYFATPMDKHTYKIATIQGAALHPMTRFQFETDYAVTASECTGVAECTGSWVGPVGELNLEMKP